MVDDQIKENELHLLRLCPLAWLSADKESRFENMPTKFGPVTLRARLDASGKELQVWFSIRPHSTLRTPHSTLLHVPPVPGLKTITLNGKPLKWDGKAKSVVIQ